jgi:hypothetical protein
MDTSHDWLQRKFDEVYRQTCLHLRQRRLLDPGFTPAILHRLLHTQYENQSASWTEKSQVQHIVDQATAAAYETVLAEWERELGEDRAGGDASSEPGD